MARKKPGRKELIEEQNDREPQPAGPRTDEHPGIATGGQSGDDQGLSDIPQSTSESVRELVEEGQYFEAGIVEGVENAPDPDEAEVHTKEKPEDDVPWEYSEKDQR